MTKELITSEEIEERIYLIRAKKVMLDSDLADALNRQVKRNIERFPDDFMFQFTKLEHENLINLAIKAIDITVINGLSFFIK